MEENIRLRYIKKVVLIVILLLSLYASGQNEIKNPPFWLSELANSVDMELVYGRNMPYLNSMGSYGSLYVEGVIYEPRAYIKSREDKRRLSYILFLCKQKSSGGNPKDRYNLIFATKRGISSPKEKYEIKEVYEDVGLVGMHLLQGELDINSFQVFNEVLAKDVASEHLLIDINYSWTVPVVIPFSKGRWVLIFYGYSWFVNEVVD